MFADVVTSPHPIPPPFTTSHLPSPHPTSPHHLTSRAAAATLPCLSGCTAYCFRTLESKLCQSTLPAMPRVSSRVARTPLTPCTSNIASPAAPQILSRAPVDAACSCRQHEQGGIRRNFPRTIFPSVHFMHGDGDAAAAAAVRLRVSHAPSLDLNWHVLTADCGAGHRTRCRVCVP